jgi:hypothetical protein
MSGRMRTETKQGPVDSLDNMDLLYERDPGRGLESTIPLSALLGPSLISPPARDTRPPKSSM